MDSHDEQPRDEGLPPENTAEPTEAAPIDFAELPDLTPPLRKRTTDVRPIITVVCIAAGIWFFNSGLPRLAQNARTSRPNVPRVEIPPPDDWGSVSSPLTAADEAKIAELFATVHRALEADDFAAIGARLDYPRLHREAVGRASDETLRIIDDDQFVAKMKETLPQQAFQLWDPATFEEGNYAIKRFVVSNGGNEACVFVRHRGSGGEQEKICWWLARDGDRWMVYDYEDLRWGQRMSDELADGMNMATEGMAKGQDFYELIANMRHLDQAQTQAALENFEAAQEAIQEADPMTMTPRVRMQYYVIKSMIDLNLGRNHEALAALEKIDTKSGDSPVIYHIRAVAANEIGDSKQARAAATKYLEQMGDDADGSYELGRACLGLADATGAAEHFRDALADNPQHVQSIYLLGLVLPPDEIGALRRHYLALDTPTEVLPWLCEMFWNDRRFDAMVKLLEVQLAETPDSPDCRYYQAVVQGNWGQVIDIYDREIEESELLDPAEAFRYTLAEAYFRSRQAVEALDRLQPKPEVYTFLNYMAADESDTDQLERLNERYAHYSPDDPRLKLWTAEWHYLERNHEEAYRLLNEHAEEIAPIDTEQLAFDRSLRSLLHLERFDEAVAEAMRAFNAGQDPFYPTLTYACQGDVKQTLDWMLKCLDFDYLPADLYRDPMLGPALRQEEFKGVREAIPDPFQPRDFGPQPRAA